MLHSGIQKYMYMLPSFLLPRLRSDGVAFVFFLMQVIFITEYMTSGSMGQFLRRTKKNNKTVNLKVS